MNKPQVRLVQKPSVKYTDILSLHKYFLYASQMKYDFEKFIKEKKVNKINLEKNMIELSIYMNLWYGCLFTVIEGVKRLKVNENELNTLLDNRRMFNILKACRNSIFHYQNDYYDKKYMNLMNEKESVAWIRNVHNKIGTYLLKEIKLAQQTGGAEK